MTSAGVARPFPVENRLVLEVLDEAVHRDAVPLRAADLRREPGVYLLHLVPKAGRGNGASLGSGNGVASTYAGLGTHPIYVGSTNDLRDRAGRHRRTLQLTANLDVEAFAITAVATASAGMAAFAEHSLQELLQPAWCQSWLSGFGSKSLGARRATQTVSAWSVLHPRHGAGAGPPSTTVEEILGRLTRHLEEIPAQWRGWPL